MPISYNPGVVDRSGQLLAQGISQAGQSFGRAIEKQQQEAKQLQQNGKIAEMIFKNNPELLEDAGVTQEEIGTMSAADKSALAISAIKRMEIEGQQQQNRVNAQQLKQYAGQEKFNEAIAQAAEKGEGLSAERVLALAGESGVLDPRTASSLAAASGRNKGGFTAEQMGKPQDVPGVPGYKFVPVSEGHGQLIQTGPEGEIAARLPNDPWVYSEDKETFLEGLRGLPNPKARQATLEFRRKYNLAQGIGSGSALDEWLANMTGQGNGKSNGKTEPADESKPAEKQQTQTQSKQETMGTQDFRDWSQKQQMRGQSQPPWGGHNRAYP